MTAKPEDIPQDVWDAATRTVLDTESHTHGIARAIMAAEKRGEERERKACVYAAQSISANNDRAITWYVGFHEARSAAAAAIRKRGEQNTTHHHANHRGEEEC